MSETAEHPDGTNPGTSTVLTGHESHRYEPAASVRHRIATRIRVFADRIDSEKPATETIADEGLQSIVDAPASANPDATQVVHDPYDVPTFGSDQQVEPVAAPVVALKTPEPDLAPPVPAPAGPAAGVGPDVAQVAGVAEPTTGVGPDVAPATGAPEQTTVASVKEIRNPTAETVESRLEAQTAQLQGLIDQNKVLNTALAAVNEAQEIDDPAKIDAIKERIEALIQDLKARQGLTPSPGDATSQELGVMTNTDAVTPTDVPVEEPVDATSQASAPAETTPQEATIEAPESTAEAEPQQMITAQQEQINTLTQQNKELQGQIEQLTKNLQERETNPKKMSLYSIILKYLLMGAVAAGAAATTGASTGLRDGAQAAR